MLLFGIHCDFTSALAPGVLANNLDLAASDSAPSQDCETDTVALHNSLRFVSATLIALCMRAERAAVGRIEIKCTVV